MDYVRARGSAKHHELARIPRALTGNMHVPRARYEKLPRMLGFALNEVDLSIYQVDAQPNLRKPGLVRARRSARYHQSARIPRADTGNVARVNKGKATVFSPGPYKMPTMLGFALNEVDLCIYQVDAQPNLRKLGLVRVRGSVKHHESGKNPPCPTGNEAMSTKARLNSG